MPRITHFEIPVDYPERALSIYEKIFGWRITKWEGPMEYWLITTGPEGEPGIDGGWPRELCWRPALKTPSEWNPWMILLLGLNLTGARTVLPVAYKGILSLLGEDPSVSSSGFVNLDDRLPFPNLFRLGRCASIHGIPRPGQRPGSKGNLGREQVIEICRDSLLANRQG